MRALAVCPGGVEVVEREDPQPRPTEVVVAVHACGICGSDVHHLAGSSAHTGQIIGHEFSGTIVTVGDEVESWQLGQHVAVNPLGSCGRCVACLRRLPFLCAEVPNIGLTAPGAFAERVAAPATQLRALPSGIDVELGSHAEPLSVALAAIEHAEPVVAKSALVFGIGTIGLFVIAALRAKGVGHVVAVGRSSGRRAAAAALGAETVIDARTTDLVGYSTEHHQRFDIAFDCSGATEALSSIVPTLAIGGTIVEVALLQGAVPVEVGAFVRRGLRFVGSCAFAPHHYEQAVSFLSEAVIDPEPIVSERVSLEEGPDAFERLRSPIDLVGVLVHPWR